MKIIMQLVQSQSAKGFTYTGLQRIKMVDDNGKYIKFIPHTKEVIDFLNQEVIDFPFEIDENKNPIFNKSE